MSEKYAVMPMSDYISACDTIKEKLGADSNQIKSGILPDKIGEVFEAGKQAENDEFWGELQNYGNRTQYNGAFQATMWNDTTYNPKYPIVASMGNNMFAYNTVLTDTKVPIDISGVSGSSGASYVFQGASAMVTIRSIKVKSSQTYTNFFQSCSKLKNITFEGEIGRSISFADSPLLTPNSMRSVIDHLVNYKGTTNEGKYTVTFTDDCWNALDAEGLFDPEENLGWRDYVETFLGWNT